MKEIKSVSQLVGEANRGSCKISDVVLRIQSEQMGVSQDEIIGKMHRQLSVMKQAAKGGFGDKRSASGLSGGMAKRYSESSQSGRLISGVAHRAIAIALAVAEHNACMGLIVASPTAGSCGILPGVLLSVGELYHKSDVELVSGLFNSAGIGMVIAKRAFVSGAQGGCQAECGSAAAMAASAAVELMDGTPEMCAWACAFSLKFTMGLVCDPVAGLVEVPCVKRNASNAAIALTAAELALTGIESAIPADEVIDAMRDVGLKMPEALKETSLGGLAATKTAKAIEKRLYMA